MDRNDVRGKSRIVVKIRTFLNGTGFRAEELRTLKPESPLNFQDSKTHRGNLHPDSVA